MKMRTPLKFYKMVSGYTPGEGHFNEWQEVKSEFAGRSVFVFWGEWRSAFGSQALDAHAMGVMEMATVRMPFIPEIFETLRSCSVVIAKEADEIMKEGLPDSENPNAYTLFGGVEDVREEGKLMEFKVRRYESK